MSLKDVTYGEISKAFNDNPFAKIAFKISNVKPRFKILSVSGIEYDHNANQELPEIIGEWFDLNALYIIGYKAGDCTVKSPKLEWRHFLRVQKLNDTRHPRTKVRVVKVIAWTKNGYKLPVELVCKPKTEI